MGIVCGVGTNDIKNSSIDYPIIYDTWKHMITRCYNGVTVAYLDKYVCDEWLIFSNFKDWMIKQNFAGLQLDKDILFPNNKIYSPKNCCFVTTELNSLFIDMASTRGDLPKGVWLDNKSGKYRSQISIRGKCIKLGTFNTVQEAEITYLIEKRKHIKTFYSTVGKRVRKGLKRHVKFLKDRIEYVKNSK